MVDSRGPLIEELVETARRLVAPPKGILAADESNRTASKRLESVGVVSTEESRRDYRELLITTPGLEDHISGVILYDETIRQAAAAGPLLVELLDRRGILPGIKVDTGTQPLAGWPDEVVTEGLDGLSERVDEYRSLGARFAKWRAVITIAPGIPRAACIEANAHALARYAAICQNGGLVPIVEPEVLMEGRHGIERCLDVTEAVQRAVFAAIAQQGVALEGLVLKPNMVTAGADCPQQAGAGEVAETTLACLRRTVPAAVPGVAFLSGGQDPEVATEHLHEMGRRGPHPWEVTFSYGRALQGPALTVWKGAETNVEIAQAALAHRARCAAVARLGRYTPEMEAA